MKILKQTYAEFSSDRCPQMAAALAYYAVFSLPAVLIVVVALCSFFFDSGDVEQRLGRQIASVLGPDGAEQIKSMINSADYSLEGTFASGMALLALLFGATGFGSQLQTALNIAWDVEEAAKKRGIYNFFWKRLLSLAMVLSLAFLLLVSFVLNTFLATAGEYITQYLPAGISDTLLLSLSIGVSLVIQTVLFIAIYTVLPDADVQVRDTWVGALLTAILFSASQVGLEFYISTKNIGSSYGAAGSLVLVLLWIYISTLILLLGAEFTQVWARMRGEPIAASKTLRLKRQRQSPAQAQRFR